MTTPKLALPELSTSQAGKEITHNQALAVLDQLVQLVVLDKDLSTPPGSPANGAAYIVAASPTGAWAGKAGQVAFWLASAAAWQFAIPVDGWTAWVSDESLRYERKAGVWQVSSGGGGVQSIIIACSDETTALTAGTAKVTFRMPYAFTLSAVRASLTTAQASGSLFTVDINEGGVSILSTKLTIDNTEKTSVTAATPAVVSDSALADDAEITIDIDQIGGGTAKGLKVYLIGVPG